MCDGIDVACCAWYYLIGGVLLMMKMKRIIGSSCPCTVREGKVCNVDHLSGII